MSYSQEEIEKKRLLALQRKKESQLKNNSFIPNTNTRNSITSANSSIITNENKSYNSPKVFGHGSSKYVDYKAKSENNCFKHNGKLNKQNERFNPMSTKNFFGQKSCITAKCYMLTDERFVLETSSYLPPLVEAIKKVTSRLYGNIRVIYS